MVHDVAPEVVQVVVLLELAASERSVAVTTYPVTGDPLGLDALQERPTL
jgi:hypothetical protein